MGYLSCRPKNRATGLDCSARQALGGTTAALFTPSLAAHGFGRYDLPDEADPDSQRPKGP